VAGRGRDRGEGGGMSVVHATMASPVGPLRLAADDSGLRLIEFPDPRHPVPAGDDWRSGDNAVRNSAAAASGSSTIPAPNGSALAVTLSPASNVTCRRKGGLPVIIS